MKKKILLPFVLLSFLFGGVGLELNAASVPFQSFKDLVYAKHGDRELKLDLYIPEENETLKKPFPLILWVHGGGWLGGSKDKCVPHSLGYAEKGYATGSLSYRFTDVAPFPAQVEDVKAAIRWIRAHADEYGLDPDRIGVWGASAGGYLVCMLGTTGKTKQFDKGENLDRSSEVQAVCNFFGPTHLETALEGLVLQPDRMHFLRTVYEKLIDCSLDDSKRIALSKAASPTTFADAHAAPFLHVHGTKDETVPVAQAEILHDRLRQANASSRLFLLPGAGHGGAAFFDPKLLAEIQLFFDTNLK